MSDADDDSKQCDASPAEQVQNEREVPTMAGDPEHANPQPMMANAPRRKGDYEMKPADDTSVEQAGAEHDAEHADSEHEHAEKAVDDGHGEPVEQAHDEAAPEQDADEAPNAVPGTPASTDPHLPAKPVQPARAPAPGTIVASKTASSNPVEGIPILDSNHSRSHIEPPA